MRTKLASKIPAWLCLGFLTVLVSLACWPGRASSSAREGRHPERGLRFRPACDEWLAPELGVVRAPAPPSGLEPAGSAAPGFKDGRPESPCIRIVQADGRGVAARVTLFASLGDAPVARDITDGQTGLATRLTEANGEARFEGIAPGRYLARVDRFADAFMPPLTTFEGAIRAGENVFLEEVTLDALSLEHTFVLEEAAWLEGFVRDDAGVGIAQVQVCVTSQDANSPRSVYSSTDPSGSYQLRCSPGRQRVNVFLGRVHPWSDAARPVPKTVDVRSRDVHFADFVLSRTGANVGGRVLDQDGQAVSDLEVLCYYQPDQSLLPESEREIFTLRDRALSTRTGPDGRFELRGLPRERFGIQVGPEDYQPIGRGRLGMVVPRRIADLRSDACVDLGCIPVVRSRPFWVHGLVPRGTDARPWSEENGFRLYAVLAEGPRRSGRREVPVSLQPLGASLVFEWGCETPEDLVRFELRGPSGVVAQCEVEPTPGGTAQARILPIGGS